MFGESSFGALGMSRAPRKSMANLQIGALPDSSSENRAQFKPTAVLALAGKQTVALALGKHHSIALTGAQ
jgi:hypothetical protein